MPNNPISFMKFVRNVITIEEVKAAFETGECDHYYQLEKAYGTYPVNSYSLIKIKDDNDSGLIKNRHRENTRKRLLKEKN